MPFKGQRAGTRSRRPQGVSDGGALLPIIDTTGDGIPDRNREVQVATVSAVPTCSMMQPGGGFSRMLATGRPGGNGYATGNAKYLHIMWNNNSGNNQTLSVWGFNYTIGRWAQLQVATGNSDGNNNVLFGAVNLTIPTGTTQHFIVPIYGIDRIGFEGFQNPAGGACVNYPANLAATDWSEAPGANTLRVAVSTI